MSVEVFSKNREYEEGPVLLSYGEYRELCDEMQPTLYRKTGIDSDENYEAALHSRRTRYLELNGRSLPLFVPLEHAGGYNVENTKELTGREHIYALALPLQLLDDSSIDMESHLAELEEDAAVIVQTEASETAVRKEALQENLSDWKVGEFTNPNLPDENKHARITLYSGVFTALDDEGRLIPSQELSWQDRFDAEKKERHLKDIDLIDGRTLRENPEPLDQLWALHDDRFTWLGQYHPVSMQEDEDFFKHIVENNHTTSFVRYEYDEAGNRIPGCHACFIEDPSLIEWMSERFATSQDDERILFFYGIASRSSPGKTMHYAREIMELNSRLVKRGGGKTRLLFESTEISSLYIPRLVAQYAGEAPEGAVMTEPVHAISQVDYWYLASGASETV